MSPETEKKIVELLESIDARLKNLESYANWHRKWIEDRTRDTAEMAKEMFDPPQQSSF